MSPPTFEVLGKNRLNVFGIHCVDTASAQEALLERRSGFCYDGEEELKDTPFSSIAEGLEEQVKAEGPA